MRASQAIIPKGGMTKKAREERGMRQCPDIGLWALDNGRRSCGNWRTKACEACFNNKTMIYKYFRLAWGANGKDEINWNRATAENFVGLSRVRLVTRGEAFPDIEQVIRVGLWIGANPYTKFWIPTRAFQMGIKGGYALNMPMIEAIEKYIMIYPNARVQASLDDWTSQHWEFMAKRGWSTMYYSKDLNDHPALGKEGSNVVKCRKTWDTLISPETGREVHRKGVCRTCRKGCFSSDRVDVWLKYHQ